MNTHLDNQGSRARFESAHLIRRKIWEYRGGEMGRLIRGTFLAGDLNSEETEEAYLALTEPGGLVDTFKSVDSTQRYGNENTFTGFEYQEEPPNRIDYVLLDSGEPTWTVEGYAVLTNEFDDGVLNSDHRAVVADLTLPD